MADTKTLENLARLVRYYILFCTTTAGSGHPTSSLSAADIMAALFFNKLKFDLKNPDNPNNDRVIFSKGHVSPLIYSLYAAAGEVSEEELLSYRKFGSPLEGHPNPRFKFTEVATGSLGQGLSIGVGMALAIKQETRNMKHETRDMPMVYVLMGDSECAEGSVWEAAEIASHYKLGNLVGIVDVNRLGQSGETMLGWDVTAYARRFEAFGWGAKIVDGHNLEEIVKVLDFVSGDLEKPTAIIAKTVKGKGVSFLENKEGWHGKALSKEEFEKAMGELGDVDKKLRGAIKSPVSVSIRGPVTSFPPASARSSKIVSDADSKSLELRAVGNPSRGATPLFYEIGQEVATRKAYGEAIAALGAQDGRIVVLDAEVKNSTYAEIFKEKFPERFFEMFIGEQNMVGAATGFSKRGYVPFVSTFAAFFTRAFDQIRMGVYSRANVKFVGSHAGVSIGEDGPSQMGLEDLALFRALLGSVVFCPGDANACAKLTKIAAENEGMFYIRTNRPATKVIYKPEESFSIGGSKVVKSTAGDRLTIAACGVTLFEALAASEVLEKEGIGVTVIDAYSVKPVDKKTITKSAKKTNNIVICVEDHLPEGGLGDAVLEAVAAENIAVYKMAVFKMPMSGKAHELLDYEEISTGAIVKKVKEIVGKK